MPLLPLSLFFTLCLQHTPPFCRLQLLNKQVQGRVGGEHVHFRQEKKQEELREREGKYEREGRGNPVDEEGGAKPLLLSSTQLKTDGRMF